ncbi:MAG: cohesin domain-containing protein, partial [Chloroflexota bacterium]
YRYADTGTQPTPVPTTTPVPATPTPKPPTDPSLVVNVNPSSAAVNSTISVDLALWNVQNIYGLQTTCKVDPKVLQGAARGDGDIFNSGNSFFVDKGFQSDGTWIVGASRLQPNPVFTGNGIAFKLSFTVKSTGPSTVNCVVLAVDANGKEVALKVVNGSFNGAPVATPQPTAQPTTVPPTMVPTQVPTTVAPTPTVALTPTLVATAKITGKMVYQNYPDNSNITVQLVTDKGAVVSTMTTGADGTYSFSNVPMGTLGITAVGNLYLRIGKVVNITTTGQALDLGTLTLPGGDTDNSGDISLTDASLIGANFDITVNPAPVAADVNGDGVINIRDLAIIGGNFGLKSPIIIK